MARNLRLSQDHPSDVWHLDEAGAKISGCKYRLWRAVDQHGVLDEILKQKRDKRAAKRLLRSLMKRLGFIPKRTIADKLRSYGATKQEVAPGLDHWSHRGLGIRAVNSHLVFRYRERTMHGHRSRGGLQRFVATHSAIRNCFCGPVRRRSALTIRCHRLEAFDAWKAATRAA